MRNARAVTATELSVTIAMAKQNKIDSRQAEQIWQGER